MRKFECFLPVTNPISQRFGESVEFYRKAIGTEGHNGIDFACPRGTPVLACHDGIIHSKYTDINGGYNVTLRTLEQDCDYLGKPVYMRTIYCHLQAPSIREVGERVNCGDVLGYSGNTGLSTGPHLHLGLKPCIQPDLIEADPDNGMSGAIDPALYFNGIYAGSWKVAIPLWEAIKRSAAKLFGQYPQRS
jgi:murein DD-endopeptidase MepM/ murein hydrolase activator NlpD